ncbi:hypothetical protein ABZV91_06700 [Nocardia sp. NPDC004568]|uniref:hypothetical protein n=1 Tax=Nocardia sp. NPDC004568 TaxID=3154551 RepID=UPI0033A235B8
MNESPMSLIQLRSRLKNPVLGEAVESLPGYTAAMDVLEQSIQRRDALGAPPELIPEEVEEVITAGVIPDDFAERVSAHRAATADHQATHEALEILRGKALHRCNSIILANLDQVFVHLNGRLVAVVDEAKAPAEVLRDIHSADDAIRAGTDAIRAFEQFDGLWKRYREIREAQDHALRHFGGADLIQQGRSNRCRDELANDLFIANLDEVYPQWRHWPGDSREHSVDRGPWPEPGPLQLKWLIANGAYLWVPTKPQFDGLKAARTAMNQEVRKQAEAAERKGQTFKAPRTAADIRRLVPKDDQGRPLWQAAKDWPDIAELTRGY